MNRNQYDKLDGYNTSKAILEAIEQVAGEDFDPEIDSDETNKCHRIWADPTPEEIKEVEILAWALAHPDENALNWGAETIYRQ